jgi:hypothetical protein
VAKTRRKRRRRGGSGGKKAGVMMGMRSGFKNLADNVTGSGAREKKKSSVLGTVVTIALVIAAAAFAWYRFG